VLRAEAETRDVLCWCSGVVSGCSVEATTEPVAELSARVPVSPDRQGKDEPPRDVIGDPRRDHSSHGTFLGGLCGRATGLGDLAACAVRHSLAPITSAISVLIAAGVSWGKRSSVTKESAFSSRVNFRNEQQAASAAMSSRIRWRSCASLG
jgi:hypothetical protein